MKRGALVALLAAAALVLLASYASNPADLPVVTTASDPAPAPLPNLDGPAELEAALVSYGECVEQSFPIVMRFRTDAFIGLETEVGSQLASDGDRVDEVMSDCDRQLDLDRRLSAYHGEHELSRADRRKLVDDFVSCAQAVSAEVSDRVIKANLETFTDVTEFVSALLPRNSDLTGDELVGISECQSEMTGPEMVFADGHPWFTP